MANVVVIAGASPTLFEGISSLSSKALAPNGIVVRKPLKKGVAVYTSEYAGDLVRQTAIEVAKLEEAEKISVLLIYMSDGNGSEQTLLTEFFPFAMPLAIDLPEGLSLSASPSRRQVNEIKGKVVDAAQKLRSTGKIISDRTSVRNLTPLILPVGNFKSEHMLSMLNALYREIGRVADPGKLIDDEVQRFRSHHPQVTPPGGNQHCYSDGHLYFKSPGRHRHGFFRNSSSHAHADDCILRARSRIGGAIEYTMHYDCMPVRSLRPSYPNCHQKQSDPKDNHVNIGPSDFII